MRVTCVGARNERARSVSKSGDLNKCIILERESGMEKFGHEKSKKSAKEEI